MAERPAGGGSPRSPAEQPCAVAAKEVPDSVASTASGVSTTAPPEDESSDGFELRFDATLQQIHAGIGQAYGHAVASSLQSPKWDRRAQALKAVASALEGRPCGSDSLGSPAGGAGSAGGAVGWRFSCQLLHHVMRDKVMPVRLAACDLFMATFAKTEAAVSQAEGRFALGTLLEHLIDRLGDSNLRLHESARRCVLFAAEMSSFFGLGSVLARLRARLESSQGSERARVHFGILDAIGVLLEHFPGRRGGTEPHRPECAEDDDLSESGVGRGSADSWTQDDVAPFIAAGMDDALGQRVRDRAVALAVAVYQTFGAEAMLPLLTGLRPAKQALLRNWRRVRVALSRACPFAGGIFKNSPPIVWGRFLSVLCCCFFLQNTPVRGHARPKGS
ncbi:unnamed protein product [Prorocentrum cordatum]|uniref:TOG domain-containing protein n=1 Tax=Prorocentrum cordatum TaxID=2364126 RepID=A0ABN9SIB8_9DINO|nr:unnamed protein product [Polarella glacialis]